MGLKYTEFVSKMAGHVWVGVCKRTRDWIGLQDNLVWMTDQLQCMKGKIWGLEEHINMNI